MQVVKTLSNWLAPQQLVSDASAQWMIECFDYAGTYFDQQEFAQRTQLIQPTNQFFGGRVSSVEEKAANIFEHCINYAGVAHWPFQLVHAKQNLGYPTLTPDTVVIERNSQQKLPAVDTQNKRFLLTYNPQQTLKPEDLAASFSGLLAQYLIFHAPQLPPQGETLLAEASEVLAVYMGFGVVLANSAYTFRGGCGSCFNPSANRQASLTENEVLFALALFCHYKQLPASAATKHLKKHLKSSFKAAQRQVKQLLVA